MVVIKTTGHVHIHAAQKRLACCSRPVVSYAMCHELGNRSPVAVNNPLEAPLRAQNLSQGKRVCGSRYCIQGIERAHQCCGARIDCGMEGRQIKLAQRVLRKLYAVVIASAFRSTVADKVLRARRDAVCRIQPGALVATHVGARHRRAEIGIFSGALGHSSPSGVSRNIHHRRKSPTDTARGGFARCHARGPFH